jgi:hypothetical protein
LPIHWILPESVPIAASFHVDDKRETKKGGTREESSEARGTFCTHHTELTVTFELARAHNLDTTAPCAVQKYTKLPGLMSDTFVLL